MLFFSSHPIHPVSVPVIIRAIHALDAFAVVAVEATTGRVRIDGRLTSEQASAALLAAGCDDVALSADVTRSGHVRASSTCCGSCS